ncbi:MAG: CBS domain-containing protein [Nitrospira sp.]|nr:CBS domain-containing protein [Nitrospira sp.]MDH4302557.1 CBS domain-containing protein [Nitrospira sp.]MDH5193244.1 CBS domain-containing protein [Nitrospira sp.]
MPKRVRTGLTRGDILDRYVERFKQQLVKFQPFLSRKRGAASLEDFDEAAEELISQVFGAASDEAESYFYAKTGESALLPEEAQESGTHNIERESLHQRRQVLESCLADLELRRRLQTTRKGKSLDQMLVEDYMSHDVRSIHKDAMIKQAGQLLQKYKVGSLIVDDGSRYIGIVTESDLTRKAVAKGLDPNKTTVAACMSRSLITIEEDEPLSEAMALMKKQGIRHLPVTADATMIGVLSLSDLLRAFEDQRSA